MAEIWMGIDAGYGKPGFAFAEVSEETGRYSPGKYVYSEAYFPECKQKENYAKFSKLTQTQQDILVVQQITARVIHLINAYTPTTVICELPTGGAKSASAVRAMGMATSMTVAAITTAQLYLTDIDVLTDQNREFRFVPITPMQNKKGSTKLKKWVGTNHDEDKWTVLRAVQEVWPDIPFPKKKSKKRNHELSEADSWAMSDALSCILTGIELENAGLSKLG